MSAEERTLEAIKLTRRILGDALWSSAILIYMAANEVAPGAIEDTVAEIIEYLEKTAEEEKPSG